MTIDHVLRSLAFGLHAMFSLLVVFGVLSAYSEDTLTPLVGVLAAALVVLYLFRRHLAGLAALTLVWAALMFYAQDFMWLEFPLVFLYLQHLPRGIRVPAVGLLWAVAAFFPAWRFPGDWTIAHAIGPAIGTVFAIAMFFSYLALRTEAERYRDLAFKLRETQDELARSENLAGRLAERERLSREIHDTVAQGLSSIVLMSRAANNATNPAGHLRTIHDVAEESLQQARRFVAELSAPPALDSALKSLIQAQRDRARALGQDTSFELNLTGATDSLPDQVAEVLERAAREGLSNAAKHAHAHRVVVTLNSFDGQVTLDVADDGVGLRDSPAGYGLNGLGARVREAGGTLTLEDRNPGTVLSVAFDLAAQ